MKKILLLSQLICMSALFAPEDTLRTTANSESSRGLLESDALSVSTREIAFVDSLDRVMFKHWYGDWFKTNKINGVSYFIELPNRETKSPFILLGMSACTQVSRLSVCVSGVVQDTFRTNNGRPARFKYTAKQDIKWSEVKDMFESLVPKAKKMRKDIIDELNDAYDYGYDNRLPLDSIEAQDETDAFYLICGIAQEGTEKHCFISEPESIRIRIKASSHYPESRMSRRHLSAEVSVPTWCPEFYMSRKYLVMYHSIYSSLNQELIQLTTDIPEFAVIEGYSPVPDIIQKQPCWIKSEKARGYLEDAQLEPTIYIPTYQRDALTGELVDMTGELTTALTGELTCALTAELTDMTGELIPELTDELADESHELLTFTHSHDDWFKTEVINDLSYMISIPDRTDLGDTFRLSDLADKQITGLWFTMPNHDWGCLYTGDGFKYRITKTMPGNKVADAFKDILQKARKLLDYSISIDFPLEMVSVEEGGDKRFLEIRASDKAKILINKGRQYYEWQNTQIHINLNEDDTIEKFLTEEKLIACRDVCVLTYKSLNGLIEREVTGEHIDIPELLKEQPFWPEAEGLLKQIGDNVSVQIPTYQHDALICKAYKLLTFTRDNAVVRKFKTTVMDGVSYAITLSNIDGLGDTFKLSDLPDNRNINSLLVDMCTDSLYRFRYNKEYKSIITRESDLALAFEDSFQKVMKLHDGSIAQLRKIESLAMVNVTEHRFQTFLQIWASDKGKKLHPEWTGEFEAPMLQIPLNDVDTVEKFLTEENLVKCGDVCDLIRNQIKELLSGVTEFDYRCNYPQPVPESLKKQLFWSKTEILLKQIGDNVCVRIPSYEYYALIAKLGS